MASKGLLRGFYGFILVLRFRRKFEDHILGCWGPWLDSRGVRAGLEKVLDSRTWLKGQGFGVRVWF